MEALLIERACERLVVDSARLNDERQWAELANLYTPTGVVVRGPPANPHPSPWSFRA